MQTFDVSGDYLDIDTVEALPDLRERVREASEAEQKIAEQIEALRAERHMAMMIARFEHDTPPVRLYEEMGISRGMFNRYVKRLVDPKERRWAAQEQPGRYGTAEACIETLRDLRPRLEDAEALRTRYRNLRTEGALLLMAGLTESGERTTPAANVDIERLTGLTSARVAQLRLRLRTLR